MRAVRLVVAATLGRKAQPGARSVQSAIVPVVSAVERMPFGHVPTTSVAAAELAAAVDTAELSVVAVANSVLPTAVTPVFARAAGEAAKKFAICALLHPYWVVRHCVTREELQAVVAATPGKNA
jgi:hypothetical protein